MCPFFSLRSVEIRRDISSVINIYISINILEKRWTNGIEIIRGKGSKITQGETGRVICNFASDGSMIGSLIVDPINPINDAEGRPTNN